MFLGAGQPAIPPLGVEPLVSGELVHNEFELQAHREQMSSRLGFMRMRGAGNPPQYSSIPPRPPDVGNLARPPAPDQSWFSNPCQYHSVQYPSPPQQWCLPSSSTDSYPRPTTSGEMRFNSDPYRPPTWEEVKSVCSQTSSYSTSHSPHPNFSPNCHPSTETIINGHFFSHQFPGDTLHTLTTSTQNLSYPTYHSPQPNPYPWIYQPISQNPPSSTIVHPQVIPTKTMTTQPVYYPAPPPTAYEQPHPISDLKQVEPALQLHPFSMEPDQVHERDVPVAGSGYSSFIPELMVKLEGSGKLPSPQLCSGELSPKERTDVKMSELREFMKRSTDTFISEFKEELRLLMPSWQSRASQVDDGQKVDSLPPLSKPELISATRPIPKASSSPIDADNGTVHNTFVDSCLNVSYTSTDRILGVNDSTSMPHVAASVFGDKRESDKKISVTSGDGTQFDVSESIISGANFVSDKKVFVKNVQALGDGLEIKSRSVKDCDDVDSVSVAKYGGVDENSDNQKGESSKNVKVMTSKAGESVKAVATYLQLGSSVSTHLSSLRNSSTSTPAVGLLFQNSDGTHKLVGVRAKEDYQKMSLCGTSTLHLFDKVSESDGLCNVRKKSVGYIGIRDKGGGLTTHCKIAKATQFSAESFFQLPEKNNVADHLNCKPSLVSKDLGLDEKMVQPFPGITNQWGWCKQEFEENAIPTVSLYVCKAGVLAQVVVQKPVFKLGIIKENFKSDDGITLFLLACKEEKQSGLKCVEKNLHVKSEMVSKKIWERWKSMVTVANEYCTEELHESFLDNHMKFGFKCLGYVLGTLDAFHTILYLLSSQRECRSGLVATEANHVTSSHSLDADMLQTRQLGILDRTEAMELGLELNFPFYLTAFIGSQELVPQKEEECLKKKAAGANLNVSLNSDASFADLVEYTYHKMQELMRPYVTIHSDHGGRSLDELNGNLCIVQKSIAFSFRTLFDPQLSRYALLTCRYEDVTSTSKSYISSNDHSACFLLLNLSVRLQWFSVIIMHNEITSATFLCVLLIKSRRGQGYPVILGIASLKSRLLVEFTVQISGGLVFAILLPRIPLIMHQYARLQNLLVGSFILMTLRDGVANSKLWELLAATLLLNKVESEGSLIVALASYVEKVCSGCPESDDLQQSCKKFDLCDDQLKAFIWSNLNICIWGSLSIICLHGLALLWELILKNFGPCQNYRSDSDSVLGRFSLWHYQSPFGSSDDTCHIRINDKTKLARMAYYLKQYESMLAATDEYISAGIDRFVILSNQQVPLLAYLLFKPEGHQVCHLAIAQLVMIMKLLDEKKQLNEKTNVDCKKFSDEKMVGTMGCVTSVASSSCGLMFVLGNFNEDMLQNFDTSTEISDVLVDGSCVESLLFHSELTSVCCACKFVTLLQIFQMFSYVLLLCLHAMLPTIEVVDRFQYVRLDLENET